MRKIASLSGFVLAVSLSACAGTAGLPDMSLFSGSGGGEKAVETAAPEAVVVANTPPVPERNARKARRQPTSQRAAAAPQQQPQQQDPQQQSPQETKQTGLSLPGLSDVKLFTATSHPSDQSQWGQAPIAVYTQLAQQIRACWFTPGAPKLKNHGFHAEVSPKNADSAKIIIYEKDPEGKRGIQAFRIDINGGSSGSTVRGENRRLDKILETTFKSDLERWSKGEQGCKS